MIILKVAKSQCFTFYLEDTFFEKPQVGVKSTSPRLFRVNQCCQYLSQYLNLPTLNQPSQSNQFFLDLLVEFLNLYVDCIGLFVYLDLLNYKF